MKSKNWMLLFQSAEIAQCPAFDGFSSSNAPLLLPSGVVLVRDKGQP